jgi:hypothetical protein
VLFIVAVGSLIEATSQVTLTEPILISAPDLGRFVFGAVMISDR